MLLLAAVCCVGAASANELTCDAAWWNGDDSLTALQNGGTFCIVDNNPAAIINPKPDLTLSGNLILDFSKYKGTFAGIPAAGSEIGQGALFGKVYLKAHTLEISGLNMASVTVEGNTHSVGGIIGRVYDEGNLNIANCHFVGCSVYSHDSTNGITGILIGGIEKANVNVNLCTIEQCSVTGPSYGAGLIGYHSGPSMSFLDCVVRNSTISVRVKFAGGLVGFASGGPLNIEKCNVENTSIWCGSNECGGIAGSCGTNYMNNCKVMNSVIFGAQHCGGLVGSKTGDNYINNINNCEVSNCGIRGALWDVGGLVGCTDTVTTDGWGNNAVINCAIINIGNPSTSEKGTRTSFICGDRDMSAYCTVTNSYLSINDATILEPSISVYSHHETSIPSSLPEGTLIITKLSGIGLQSDPKEALSYVLVVTDLIFNPNNGTDKTYPGKVRVNELKTDVFATPIYHGYTFDGWKLTDGTLLTDKEGNLQKDILPYTNADGKWIYNSVSPLTLYANWVANKYKVTLNANGGTGGTNEVEVTYNAAMPAISSFPTKTHYTFDGYYDDISAGTQYYDKDGKSVRTWDKANDAILYAHWVGNKTVVTLSQTDATTKGTTKITATYNSSVHETITNPQRIGYDFAGWYSAATSGVKVIGTDGTYVDAAEFVSDGKWIKDVEEIPLYANWTASKYTVTFDKNGGDTEASPKEISETYDSNYILPITEPKKDKYDFVGWYTAADGGSQVTESTVVKTASEHTIYAHWDGKPYEESVNEEHVADFSNKGLPVVKVDVGKNNGITKVKFQFKNGKPAVISTNPAGFKNTKTFGDEFDLSITITGEQTGDVIVFFTAGNSGHYFLAHLKNNVWEFLKAELVSGTQYKAVVTKESGFSPFQIVSAEPEDVPQSHSSSRDYGASIWLPATAEPTAAPTEAQPTQAVPTASPVKPTPAPATPTPFVGLLAGLAVAGVLFGLRRR